MRENTPFDFTVKVNGQNVPLYQVMTTFTEGRVADDGSHYEIGSFDNDGAVEVEITSERDLSRTVILPERFQIPAEKTPHTLKFNLEKHGTYVFEPGTYRDTPLILFFNEQEKNVPDRNDPKVRWFGPGLHKPGKIELGSGETLYLAPGSIVEGQVFASGDHITVCGRGILTQRNYPRFGANCTKFTDCTDLVISGIIDADPCNWNMILQDCHRVTIDQVKICGGRMLNDDGIDVCNSEDVVIRNSFVRAQDDIIALKGIFRRGSEKKDSKYWETIKKEQISAHYETSRAIRNVLVENCVFWCDIANIFRIGYECSAAAMEKIIARNCDIVHVSDVYRAPEDYWTNTVWYIQPAHKMPIRDLVFEGLRIYMDVPDQILMRITPMECGEWTGCGTVENCVFRNITVSGPAEKTFRGAILIAGHDAESMVKNIQIENVTLFGKKLTAEHPVLTIGGFADKPVFR